MSGSRFTKGSFGLTFTITMLILMPTSDVKAQGSGVPITCYGDKHGSGKSAPKQYPCHNADIGSALKSKAMKYQNICLYVNGGWRIGTLTKPKDTDVASLTATNFKEKFPCTFGVEMVRKQSDNLKVVGPSVNDIIADCAAGDKACLNTIDASKIEVPKLNPTEVIATCYTKQSVGGTSEGSISCSQIPSQANYCAYEDVQSSLVQLSADDKKRFKGKWFLVYTNPGKKTPKICKGGVQISESSSESVEQEVVLSGSIDGTKNVLNGAVSFVPNNRSTTSTFTTTDPLHVVGCYTTSGYRSCQNEGGCDMTDIKCSKLNEHPKTKDKEKTCYYHSTEKKWFFLEKHNKPGLACSNIDVTSKPRPDLNLVKSEQPSSSISLDIDALGKSTVSIGTNVDETKRVFSVIGGKSLEVVTIGEGAPGSVCSGSDCSGFKVSDVSGGKTQGILYVKGGARFDDGVNFQKDVIVNGSQNTAGDMSVGRNLVVSGTVSASSDRRLKSEVREISHVMDKILRLRGVTYKFDEEKFSKLRPEVYDSMTQQEREQFFSRQRIGFIAQEVERVFPEVVLRDERDPEQMRSVSYGEMSSVAIEGLKELHREIEDLKKEMQKLKNENRKMKRALESKE